MPGEQKTTQTQDQTSSTRPWEMAIPSLQGLMRQFDQLGRDPAYTARITDAIKNARAASSGVDFRGLGDQAMAGINKLYNTDVSGQVGLMNTGYEDLKRRLGSIAEGNELDPLKTPGLADALETIKGDITNSTKGVYAASGRDPSGAGSFAGTLGQGLTKGMAPIIVDQYNRNNANRMAAADALFRGAGTTASGVAGLNQIPMQNILSAIGASGSVPGLYTAGADRDLALTQMEQDAPWAQASKWLQGILPIASLGSDSRSTGRTVKSQDESTTGNILGGALGLGGLLKGTGLGSLFGLGGAAAGGAAGGISSILPILGMFSDERVKENIGRVGELDDGQPVYSYNYIGDKIPRIGLMAQEVEKVHPEAVGEVGGIKVVDYGKATESARRIGLARDFLEAA